MVLTERRDAITTYRQLRVAMPVLVAVLTAGIVHQILAPAPNCWLGSISAYYYTPSRAVFVACLCAIGTCLIIYRGNSSREDAALNVSGFLAFVVAFIPTPLNTLVVPAEPNCKRSNVPTAAQLVAAVDNNIVALLVGLTATVAVILWFRLRTTKADGAARPGNIALYGPALASALAWAIFIARPEDIRAHGHIFAAVTLFGGIVLVVFLNAYSSPRLDPDTIPATKHRTGYRVIFVAMVLAFVVIVPLALLEYFDHAVFWLEAAFILLFAAFWVLQTSEHWDTARRVPTE